ncbi:hypothetical protein AB0H49_23350 [Nocardia sp. NPDC050713]|uniref:type II toxin-antitoxin system Phd/YefM family antitoxin n=1 Tax=Nocardia sp. NPDC050713 TaxID=3154511 RepID=UPI0033E0FA01
MEPLCARHRGAANFAAVLDAATEDNEEVVITRSGDKVVCCRHQSARIRGLKETAYLLDSRATARRLMESVENVERGLQGVMRWNYQSDTYASITQTPTKPPSTANSSLSSSIWWTLKPISSTPPPATPPPTHQQTYGEMFLGTERLLHLYGFQVNNTTLKAACITIVIGLASILFPDQPVRLSIDRPNGENVMIACDSGPRSRKAVIDECTLSCRFAMPPVRTSMPVSRNATPRRAWSTSDGIIPQGRQAPAIQSPSNGTVQLTVPMTITTSDG